MSPFDPDRALGAQDAGPLFAAHGRPADHITVAEAAELIKRSLERHVPSPLRVIGQVSGLACRGHWYFSLKDESAVLRCVAWSSAARTFGFTPDEGTEVVATGHVSHYGPQGRTQLYVQALEPVGAGALELRFRAMCDELRGLGYFDEARKKPLPLLPGRIAVITSAAGAAVADVTATAAARLPAVGLLIVDTRVQGDGAAAQIARAIRWADANAAALRIDAILVTRGGGSPEDLWAFNEREVADAAFACRLPLVAAIGHESDTTVIELVADVRAATPTQAVMRLVPAGQELARQVDHLEQRLRFLVRRRCEREGERLDPARLRRAVATHVGRLGERVAALGRQLDGVSPQRVLSRGYSWTTRRDGTPVGSIDHVGAGDPIVTRVRDGSIDSTVLGTRSQEE